MDLKAELDLSGKVIIKVQLADDIRRIPIHNDAITYDELVLMMQRIFNGKLSSSDDITIKYKDEDGDLITINDSSDLSFAIQCSRVLKLIILMNSPESTGTETRTKSVLKHSELVGLKSQLRSIRDQVNKLLDLLDVGGPAPSPSIAEQSNPEQVTSEPAPANDSFVNKVNPSEFDPLQDKKEAVEAPKEVVQPPQVNHEVPENRPQSVPVVPTPPMPVSVANQNPHMADYYGRTPASGYPQISSYGSVQYPQQYTYASAGGFIPSGEHSQMPPNPNVYVNTSQASLPYQGQPQHQAYNAAQSAGYPAQGPQVNPYSKSYTQPSPQHAYMQPR